MSGACLMARREALEAVGGFDEAFFLYEEDADLCRRLRAAGWRVLFTPAAEVRHHLGRSMARAPSGPGSSTTAATSSTTASTTAPLARAPCACCSLGRALAGLVAASSTGDAGRRDRGARASSLSPSGAAEAPSPRPACRSPRAWGRRCPHVIVARAFVGHWQGEVKIAIDVRKWRDFGIGTYVRNLVRHLARLDHETTYFLFCHDSDEPTLRDLAANFVPVVDGSAGYGLREHLSIPLKLRRLGAELLHSPHYVRPLLCTIPSVVTIHDCIHLLFPQYLPNRMAWRYARFMMGSAIRHSALVFTVSEASRADILRFYPWADPGKVHVVPNAIDTELLEDPGEEEMERVRERYQLRGRFILFAGNVKPHKNLERLIAAFARVREQGGHDDLQLLLIGDDVSRYGSLRRAVEATGLRQDVRFFGFVPHQHAGRPLPHGVGLRLPVALRGLRPPAARGHVLRHAGGHLPDLLAARGGGRRRAAGGPLQRRGHRQRDLPGPRRRATCAGSSSRRAWPGPRAFSWERSVRAIHAGYMKALGRPAPALAEAAR